MRSLGIISHNFLWVYNDLEIKQPYPLSQSLPIDGHSPKGSQVSLKALRWGQESQKDSFKTALAVGWEGCLKRKRDLNCAPQYPKAVNYNHDYNENTEIKSYLFRGGVFYKESRENEKEIGRKRNHLRNGKTAIIIRWEENINPSYL